MAWSREWASSIRPISLYWFIDHWLDDIARLIDRISFADVHIDTSRRPGTQELRELAFWSNFYDLGQIVRRRCAFDIIRSPEFLDPPWRKLMLMRHYPLIEYRSLYINGVLRGADYAQYEERIGAGAGDARYERLKTQALQLAAVWSAEIRPSRSYPQAPGRRLMAESSLTVNFSRWNALDDRLSGDDARHDLWGPPGMPTWTWTSRRSTTPFASLR